MATRLFRLCLSFIFLNFIVPEISCAESMDSTSNVPTTTASHAKERTKDVTALELLKDINDLEKLKAEGSELILDLIEKRVENPSKIAELVYEKEKCVLIRTMEASLDWPFKEEIDSDEVEKLMEIIQEAKKRKEITRCLEELKRQSDEAVEMLEERENAIKGTIF